MELMSETQYTCKGLLVAWVLIPGQVFGHCCVFSIYVASWRGKW
jgi:hypothetical protein